MKLDYNYPKQIHNGRWTARFLFIAGRICIDFAQTGGKTPERAFWERLRSPTDLRDWFAISPLHLDGVEVSRLDSAAALELREAIWQAVNAIRQGQPPDPVHLEAINRAAGSPTSSLAWSLMDCSQTFVDQSRPGKRRWCLMERCGNIHKTRRYR